MLKVNISFVTYQVQGWAKPLTYSHSCYSIAEVKGFPTMMSSLPNVIKSQIMHWLNTLNV